MTGRLRRRGLGRPAATAAAVDEHVGALPFDVFAARFLRPSQPLVLREEPAARSLAQSLALPRLARRVGRVVVPVKQSRTRVFHPGHDRVVPRPLHELVDHVLRSGDAPGSTWWYLQQLSLSVLQPEGIGPLPSVLDDVPDPDLRLWIGSAGCITALHHDRADNVLMQLFGTKRVTLFDPFQSAWLYPHPAESAWSHVSRIDFDPAPDLERFPLLARASSLEVVLHPGDALFIPALWWHLVRSETPTESLNAWW